MHIPDSFIPLPQAAVYWLLAIIFIALAFKWAREELDEDKIPLVAVLAAGIFALQVFHLPVGMGTSGHLVGGALAAIALGSPYGAVFIMTILLIIQGVIFGDGGITTIGANILNIGVIGGFVGFSSYQGLKFVIKNAYISAGIAAWFACFITAAACSIELAITGTFPLIAGMTAMVLYHAVIGLVEGIITAVALYLIHYARPDLLPLNEKSDMEAPV